MYNVFKCWDDNFFYLRELGLLPVAADSNCLSEFYYAFLYFRKKIGPAEHAKDRKVSPLFWLNGNGCSFTLLKPLMKRFNHDILFE